MLHFMWHGVTLICPTVSLTENAFVEPATLNSTALTGISTLVLTAAMASVMLSVTSVKLRNGSLNGKVLNGEVKR
jgi:hypothetical protein